MINLLAPAELPSEAALDDGAHRLESARQLGWERIDAEVHRDVTDRQARLMEITENLHRNDLTALDRNEQTAEYINL